MGFQHSVTVIFDRQMDCPGSTVKATLQSGQILCHGVQGGRAGTDSLLSGFEKGYF